MPTDENDDFPPLGALPPAEAAKILAELGENELADRLANAGKNLRSAAPSRAWWPFSDQPWQHIEHAIGFIAPNQPNPAEYKLRSATSIPADTSLIGAHLKITLAQLRIAAYPGSGEHQVLFQFSAKNQTAAEAELVRFGMTVRARNGQPTATLNIPIFSGINVGPEGILLRGQTINVKNKDDEAMLEFLEGDTFRQGLKLLSTAQPAILPLSHLFTGLASTLLKRTRNVKVQEFFAGLDFSELPMAVRLAIGTYVIVQIPDSLKDLWDWSDWVYRPESGNIVSADNLTDKIPYNCIMIGISAV